MQVGGGVAWLEPDGLAEGGDGVIELSLVRQRVAEQIVSQCVAGHESNRLSISSDRLVQLPDSFQGVAKGGLGIGVFGCEPDRLADLDRRFGRFFLEMQSDSQLHVGEWALRSQCDCGRQRACGLCRIRIRRPVELYRSLRHADPEITWKATPCYPQDGGGCRSVIGVDEHARQEQQAVHRLLFERVRVGRPFLERRQ